MQRPLALTGAVRNSAEEQHLWKLLNFMDRLLFAIPPPAGSRRTIGARIRHVPPTDGRQRSDYHQHVG